MKWFAVTCIFSGVLYASVNTFRTGYEVNSLKSDIARLEKKIDDKFETVYKKTNENDVETKRYLSEKISDLKELQIRESSFLNKKVSSESLDLRREVQKINSKITKTEEDFHESVKSFKKALFILSTDEKLDNSTSQALSDLIFTLRKIEKVESGELLQKINKINQFDDLPRPSVESEFAQKNREHENSENIVNKDKETINNTLIRSKKHDLALLKLKIRPDSVESFGVGRSVEETYSLLKKSVMSEVSKVYKALGGRLDIDLKSETNNASSDNEELLSFILNVTKKSASHIVNMNVTRRVDSEHILGPILTASIDNYEKIVATELAIRLLVEVLQDIVPPLDGNEFSEYVDLFSLLSEVTVSLFQNVDYLKIKENSEFINYLEGRYMDIFRNKINDKLVSVENGESTNNSSIPLLESEMTIVNEVVFSSLQVSNESQIAWHDRTMVLITMIGNTEKELVVLEKMSRLAEGVGYNDEIYSALQNIIELPSPPLLKINEETIQELLKGNK